MPSTTQRKAASLPVTEELIQVNPEDSTASVAVPMKVVPGFAVFIDTHRDQPHVPTFEDDIHRGWCRPTVVHYIPPQDLTNPNDLGALVRDDGRMIDVDPKHRFVDREWWEEFVMDAVMETGASPVATDGEQAGQMPTSHLRDARNKVYKLKSLRQMVQIWLAKPTEQRDAAPFKPSRRRRTAA